jgi:hypothetical protein
VLDESAEQCEVAHAPDTFELERTDAPSSKHWWSSLKAELEIGAGAAWLQAVATDATGRLPAYVGGAGAGHRSSSAPWYHLILASPEVTGREDGADHESATPGGPSEQEAKDDSIPLPDAIPITSLGMPADATNSWPGTGLWWGWVGRGGPASQGGEVADFLDDVLGSHPADSATIQARDALLAEQAGSLEELRSRASSLAELVALGVPLKQARQPLSTPVRAGLRSSAAHCCAGRSLTPPPPPLP